MKSLFNRLILKTLIVLLIAPLAQAEIKPYVSFFGGFNYLEGTDLTAFGVDTGDVSFDHGYVIEGAVGISYLDYEGSPTIRAELAFSYQENDFDEFTDDLGASGTVGASYPLKGEIGISALMVNGYLDFPTRGPVAPYLLAGIGAADVNAEIIDDTVLAYQVGVGLGISVSKNVIIDVKYKYFMSEDPVESKVKIDIRSSQVLAGVRVQF